MDRRSFEQMLSRRTTRRRALQAGVIGSGLIGLSFAGAPTRSYARQATPEGVATAVPVDLQSQPSAQFGTYPFQLGVASGDPQATGVVLWTRIAPAPIDGGGMDPLPYELTWEVATDEAFGSVIQTGTAVAAPTLAHSVHVDVTGLQPATDYYYRFIIGDEVSPIGRTRTAPAAGQAIDAVNFAFVSCANFEHGYFTAYRDIARQNFDVVFHLGDYIYEYAANDYNVREPENLRLADGGETLTLELYRNRYALYHTDRDLQAVHASAPFVVTWDDHEVDNNYADDLSEHEDPIDEFLQRRADAYQAYYEHMPLRTSSLPIGPDMQLYRHLSYGDLLDFTVLDTRQYRSDHPAGDGTYPRTIGATAPETSITGAEQERWLLQNLDRSTSVWNVIAQQVIMAETYVPITEGQAQTYYTDSWSGYPGSRDRILQHIQDAAISNPVVLTGDIHTAWAADLKADFADPSSATVGTEYVCTSITAGGTTPDTWGQAYVDNFDYIKFFDGRHGGYTAVTLTADQWTSDYYAVDNLDDENSTATKYATWVTEAGNPGAQQG